MSAALKLPWIVGSSVVRKVQELCSWPGKLHAAWSNKTAQIDTSSSRRHAFSQFDVKTTFLYFEELCLSVSTCCWELISLSSFISTDHGSLEMNRFATREKVFDFSLLTYLKVTVLSFQHARPRLCHIFTLPCHTHRRKMWYVTTQRVSRHLRIHTFGSWRAVSFFLFFLASWYRTEVSDWQLLMLSPHCEAPTVSLLRSVKHTTAEPLRLRGGGSEWKRELDWLGRSQGQRKGTEVHF